MKLRAATMAVVFLVGCGTPSTDDGGTGGGTATGGGSGGGATGGGTGGGSTCGGTGGGSTDAGGADAGSTDAGHADAGRVDDVLDPAELQLAGSFSPLPALPADLTNAYADDPAAATLGQRLFYDSSYSGALVVDVDAGTGSLGAAGTTGLVSCFSCHGSPIAGDDNRSTPNNVSLGTNYGTRNTLPVVNASYNQWTNWGGRFDSQWSLPTAVAENPAIMNSTRLKVAHLLFAKYRADYDAIFPTPLDADLDPNATNASRFPPTGKPAAAGADAGVWEGMAAADRTIVNRIHANYGKAIAAYLRKLVSKEAPFDRFVAGDGSAITASAKRGFRVFTSNGKCSQCHLGPNFTDDKFHALGVPQSGPHVPATDLGRFQDVPALLSSPFNSAGAFSDAPDAGRLTGLTQDLSQLGQFRTRSLRGVGSSAPYMHSGQFATLEAVIDFYDVGGGTAPDGGTRDPLLTTLNLTTTDKADLAAFLRTLDGQPVDAALLANTAR
jgi:cytochrome c peroxidase